MSSFSFSAELDKLSALVDATSTELSTTRATRTSAAPRRHHRHGGEPRSLAEQRGEDRRQEEESEADLLPTRNAVALSELQRACDLRARHVDELVTLIEADVRAFRREHGDAADGVRGVSARVDRLLQRVGVVGARQDEMFELVQQRPTRGEVDTTIAAAVLPGAAYAKTRIDALSKTVAEVHAVAEAGASGGETGGGIAGAGAGTRGGPSLDYMEQRLERRLVDFLERKMRLRARQLEVDVVRALRSNEEVRKAWGGVGGSVVGEDSGGEAGENGPRGASSRDMPPSSGGGGGGGAVVGENGGVSAMNSSGGAGPAPPAPVKFATKRDLDEVRETFSKEMRLVQNSLVSLRTQVRALGREVKALAEGVQQQSP